MSHSNKLGQLIKPKGKNMPLPLATAWNGKHSFCCLPLQYLLKFRLKALVVLYLRFEDWLQIQGTEPTKAFSIQDVINSG